MWGVGIVFGIGWFKVSCGMEETYVLFIWQAC